MNLMSIFKLKAMHKIWISNYIQPVSRVAIIVPSPNLAFAQMDDFETLLSLSNPMKLHDRVVCSCLTLDSNIDLTFACSSVNKKQKESTSYQSHKQNQMYEHLFRLILQRSH